MPKPRLSPPFHLLFGGLLALLAVSAFGNPVCAQDRQGQAAVPARGIELGIAAQMAERRRLVPLPEPPADTTDFPDAGIQRLQIDGLVVDETATRIGSLFFDEFFRLWTAPAGAFNFTITIQEQPSPFLGTRVSVNVNDEIAFQAQLMPREEVIEGAARQAVFLAARLLQSRSAIPSEY